MYMGNQEQRTLLREEKNNRRKLQVKLTHFARETLHQNAIIDYIPTYDTYNRLLVPL